MGIPVADNDAPLYTEVILVLKRLYKDGRISNGVKKSRLTEVQKVVTAMLSNL